MLQELFEQFLQSGVYLKGWSKKTPPIYRRAFASLHEYLASVGGGASASELSKPALEAWVVWMRQKGLAPACCNIYIRAINAFQTWLKEHGHIEKKIAQRQIKAPQKVVQVFSAKEVDLLMARKPKRLVHQRTWVMIILMFDTGCRIDEVLTLKKKSIDFDNLLLTVQGKGNKQRKVPFSLVLRKHLWAYMERCKFPSEYVFSAHSGKPLTYRNSYRDIKACFAKAGVEGEHVHPHNLRHSFSCHYIKQGGSVVALSRILGHSSITTTQGYLRGLQVEDFQTELGHLSPIV